MIDYRDIITINSEKRFGKPCVRNMRITVYDVLGWLATGMSRKDILEDFPEAKHVNQVGLEDTTDLVIGE